MALTMREGFWKSVHGVQAELHRTAGEAFAALIETREDVNRVAIVTLISVNWVDGDHMQVGLYVEDNGGRGEQVDA